MEGVVAKRLDRHVPAGPAVRRVAEGEDPSGRELVVGGWLPGAGRLAGRVSSGLDDQRRAVLEARLEPLARATSPFDAVPELSDPRWVEPELVVEVRFQNWTKAGVLRAPRYRGLRDDKDPSEVVREL